MSLIKKGKPSNRLGKSCSEEHKRKLSESQLGNKHWHFGKHLPQEVKDKIRKSNTGLTRTKETKQRISLASKGRTAWNKGLHMSKQTKAKLRQIHLGKKVSIQTRQKMRLSARKGEKNHSWKGGITPQHLAIRHSFEIRLWREKVFTRDDWTCQVCKDNNGGNLNAHHIKSFSKYPELRFIVDNGITLCKDCHKKIHTFFSNKYIRTLPIDSPIIRGYYK